MTPAYLRRLVVRMPFFYGWVIVACAVCATFARQGAAVATLSVFIAPMTAEFAWSRTGISGAVSLGSVLGALVAPALGPLVDRHGARAVLTASALVVAATAFALADTRSLLGFYIAFGIARMVFAAPFDIGIAAPVSNWFLRGRARAMSYVSLSIGISLAVMPVMAQTAIDARGWRAGWVAVALAVLIVGVLPNALLMVRRPEDVGLVPDGDARQRRASHAPVQAHALPEPSFTRTQALRTPAMWLLLAYTALIFPVQAGMSLHQAPHLVQQGISPAIAASVVGVFSLAVALSSLVFGIIGSRWPVRFGLAGAAAGVAAGAVVMYAVTRAAHGYVAAALFGSGIGGLLTLLPVAWADYFGRRNFGAIRGITLPAQVVGQALGPVLAGALYDVTGAYHVALAVFAALAAAAAMVVLAARPPEPPVA